MAVGPASRSGSSTSPPPHIPRTRVLGLVGVGHRAGRPLSAPLGPGYGGGARAAEASLGPIDSLEQGTPARTVRGPTYLFWGR